MKKTGFNGYVYDFSVNYDAIADIKNIHKYLMRKNNIVENVFNMVNSFINFNKHNLLRCKNTW